MVCLKNFAICCTLTLFKLVVKLEVIYCHCLHLAILVLNMLKVKERTTPPYIVPWAQCHAAHHVFLG